MEKLQAALEKAREKRGGDRRRVGKAAKDTPSSGAVEAAWEALTPLRTTPRQLQRKRVVAMEVGPDATAFDILRTKILQQLTTNDWRRVAITSPTPGAGKTTTAANLAVSFGRQVEMRTMLLDMDMRHPTVAKLFEHKGSANLFDVLEERASFADQACRLGRNVALSMNYKPAHDPSELFLRQRTAEIIDEIDAAYRPGVMLFDMPPMLTNDDTAAFLSNVDCALIVAEADTSTVKQIDRCEKELAELTNVLGVTLNKCRFPDMSYDKQYN